MPHHTNTLIDRLSKAVGLNLKYFISSSFWVITRYVFLSLISLLISIAFARLGTKELYGQYQFALSVVSFLSLLTLPGLNTVALRAVAQNHRRSVIDTTRLCFKASWLVTFIVAVIGAVYIVSGKNVMIGWALIGAGILVPFFYGPNGWYTFYEGQLDFLSSSKRIVLVNGLVAAVLFFGLWRHWTLPWLVISYFLINSLLTGIFYLEATRQIHIPLGEVSRVNLKEGVFYTLQKWTSTLPDTIQPFIISYFYGFKILGIFLIAYTLINSAVGLVGALSATYFPLLLKYKKLSHTKIILQNLVLGGILALSYFLLVRFLFLPLYGRNYSESYRLALYFSGIIIFLPLRLYFSNYFVAQGSHKIIITSNVASYICSLVIFLIFVYSSLREPLVAYLYGLQLSAILIMGFHYFRVTRSEHALNLS